MSGPTLTAAAATRELTPELRYVRAGELREALPATARVIDLRYADPTTVPAVPPLGGIPTLILVGPDTPAAWLAISAQSTQVLTLAAAAANPGADLLVKVDLAADQAAYAFIPEATEAQWDTLLGRQLTKRRFDEAELLQQRENSAAATRDDAARNAPGTPPAEAAREADAAATVPADPVLQRAIQVYLGLRALGRW